MRNNSDENERKTLLPEDWDFLEPSGGNRLNPPPVQGDRPESAWKLSIVMLMLNVVKFFLRPVWMMAMLFLRPVLNMMLPMIATSLLVGVATWYWYPTAFSMATNVVRGLDDPLDLDRLAEWVKQLSENLSTLREKVSATDSAETLSEKIELPKDARIADRRMPSVLLAPQPQP